VPFQEGSVRQIRTLVVRNLFLRTRMITPAKPLKIPIVPMKGRTRTRSPAKAQRWARRLMHRVQVILAEHPDADPDNVRHTLILLQQAPLTRLERSLVRGRRTPLFRK